MFSALAERMLHSLAFLARESDAAIRVWSDVRNAGGNQQAERFAEGRPMGGELNAKTTS